MTIEMHRPASGAVHVTDIDKNFWKKQTHRRLVSPDAVPARIVAPSARGPSKTTAFAVPTVDRI